MGSIRGMASPHTKERDKVFHELEVPMVMLFDELVWSTSDYKKNGLHSPVLVKMHSCELSCATL